MWKRRRDVPVVVIMESYIGYCMIQYYSRLCASICPFSAPSLYGIIGKIRCVRRNKLCVLGAAHLSIKRIKP